MRDNSLGIDQEENELCEDLGQTIEVLWGGRLETISVHDLEVGDIIFVAAGWAPPTMCRGTSKLKYLDNLSPSHFNALLELFLRILNLTHLLNFLLNGILISMGY